MTAAFSIGPADERTLDLGAYLVGATELALIVGSLALTAFRVRSELLPGWSGAPARLAELVLGTTALIWISEILGTFAAFGEWELILTCLAGGLAAWAITGRLAVRRALDPLPRPTPPAPEPATVAKVVAAVACAAVAAGWAIPTLGALAAGMDRADTLWYHMPLSARFVQTGELGNLEFFDPIFFAHFYPANSEVLHAVPLLTFDRDIVSPLLNLGFVAIGLLACWCIGRPWGLGPHALVGGAIALGAQNLIEFQAGEALNDITGVAFVLAAVALLINGYVAMREGGPGRGPEKAPRAAALQSEGGPGRGPEKAPRAAPRVSENDPVGVEKAFSGAPAGPPLLVAGLAAGIAAGTKLSFLAPVAALFVGVIVISRGSRVRAAALFGIPLLLAGGYWYVRNLVTVGNPIPFTTWGPLDLPMPGRDLELRPGFSVFHYWNDTEVWWDWFGPGLDESFGLLWPVTLLAMLGAAVYAAARAPEPLLRALGAMVLVTTVAYVFTPLTAGGEEGMPIAFEWNVRYLAPATAVGLAILPCLPAFRATPGRRALTLAGLGALLAVTVASLVQWQQGHTKGAIAAGVATLVALGAYAWLRGRDWLGPRAPATRVALITAAALAAALAAGHAEQRHYLTHRFENTSPHLKLAEAIRWGRDLRGARVAVSGIRGVFNQYAFYGTDLSSRVQWLGEEGDDGAYLRIPACERWRAALNEGDFTHAVTTYDPFAPGELSDTKEALWTRRDRAAKQVFRDGPVSIFEIEGELDPTACGRLPGLGPAELNGASVNERPLANQP